MNLGMRLQNKRIECNMKQEDVAKKMEISQKTISSWERGRTTPKVGDYVKLSKIYGCRLSDLTGQDDTDPSKITLKDIMSKLPDLEIEELQEIIKKCDSLISEKEEKQMLLARIKEYEKRIKELENKS